LRSTDLATLFLNRQLCIRRFTPAITRLINLLPSDIGRPFSDIAPKFSDQDLIPHCERVLADLVPIEKEIAGPQDRWYLRTVLPYRTEEDRIDGVVITSPTSPPGSRRSCRWQR
jgi:two-component system CheB/CheR fusion protein